MQKRENEREHQASISREIYNATVSSTKVKRRKKKSEPSPHNGGPRHLVSLLYHSERCWCIATKTALNRKRCVAAMTNEPIKKGKREEEREEEKGKRGRNRLFYYTITRIGNASGKYYNEHQKTVDWISARNSVKKKQTRERREEKAGRSN